MDKEENAVCVYTHTQTTLEYFSVIKKECKNDNCSNMDGPRDYPTKWGQTDKDKYIIYM